FCLPCGRRLWYKTHCGERGGVHSPMVGFSRRMGEMCEGKPNKGDCRPFDCCRAGLPFHLEFSGICTNLATDQDRLCDSAGKPRLGAGMPDVQSAATSWQS